MRLLHPTVAPRFRCVQSHDGRDRIVAGGHQGQVFQRHDGNGRLEDQLERELFKLLSLILFVDQPLALEALLVVDTEQVGALLAKLDVLLPLLKNHLDYLLVERWISEHRTDHSLDRRVRYLVVALQQCNDQSWVASLATLAWPEVKITKREWRGAR
ncbi:hypothetical protein JG687_00018205 [Phytophthora cactorum]|uniref:Uncharacterized protein n=1 Tax=Phytophthora cactorum TaxID=29920 RepID=A0A8T1TPF4_9STRA|nr:hypothetical protein JG687_00018205 [Phytophthora cactorum]